MSVATPAHTPVDALLRLDDKVAVVTGAARGIGRAIAERLAEAGARTFVTDIDGDVAQDAAREISDHTGARVSAVALDVCDTADLRAVAQSAVSEYGRLDIWVNNAGIFPPQDPLTVDPAGFHRVIKVNLEAAYAGAEAAAEQMRERGRGGVILNVASTAAYHGPGAYSASKWALRGVTKGLAPLLGPLGIRVVAVAPTLVETPGIAHLRDVGGDEMRALLADLAARLPLGRVGTPDDIARAALFLVSDAASFITGVTLPVDGGELSL